MIKKHFEFAAHIIVNEAIDVCELKFTSLRAYKAYIALFKQYGASFDKRKFDRRIKTLLTK